MGVIRQVAARAKVHRFLIWSSSNVTIVVVEHFVAERSRVNTVSGGSISRHVSQGRVVSLFGCSLGCFCTRKSDAHESFVLCLHLCDKKRVTAIQSFVLWSSSNVCVVEYVTSVFFSAKPVWTPVVLATQPCGRAPPSFETSTRLVETEYTKRQTITRMVETEYTTCRSLSSIYCNASKAFWTKLFTFASTACL